MRNMLMALALLAAASTQALAGSSKCGGDKDKKERTQYVREVGPDGTVVYRITSEWLVCGKVPQPAVLYGILNSSINYEWATLKQDFLTKVVQSVEQSPF